MKVTLVTLKSAQSGSVQDKALFIKGEPILTTNSDVTRLHNIDEVAKNLASSYGAELEVIEHTIVEGESWADITARYFASNEPADINVTVTVHGGAVQDVNCTDTHGRKVNVEVIDYDVESYDPEHLDEVDDGIGNISHASVSSWEFKALSEIPDMPGSLKTH